MPAPASSLEVLNFGVFELDLRRAELGRQGAKVKLQEQPLKVLQLLLEKPGEIVTREQLRTHIWSDNTFVEFDHGLYSAMARLREALGDSAESPRFIETVARRGYRFIAQQADIGKVLAHTTQSEDDTLKLAALTGSNAVSGNRTEAQHLLARLTLISKRHYVCPYEMATAHAVLGDRDEAIEWLRRGFRERSGCMVDLKTDPRLDSLRSDPKFNQLLRQVGFEP